MKYNTWNREEYEMLLSYLKRDLSVKECAKLLDRSYDSVQKKVKLILNDPYDKFMLLADTHVPHNIKMEAVYEFIDDFRPDIIAFLGDIIDPDPISPWNRKKKTNVKAQADPNRDLEVDMQKARYLINRTSQYSYRKIYIPGNHEGWLTLLGDEIPYIRNTVANLKDKLELGDEWEIVEPDHSDDPKRRYARIGKLRLIHGWYYNKYHAAKTVEEAECNIAYGHVHDCQSFTKVNMLDADPHMAVSIPCLCDLSPEYRRDRPNRWVNGFAWGAVHKITGHFSLYRTIIVGGKFWVGKGYSV